MKVILDEIYNNHDENKTLLELCKMLDAKTNFESYVVQTSESAIRKPLKELSNEEIRLLIGQKIGLKYLIPMALHILDENILIDCHYYNGDLLEALLELNKDDWKNNDIKKFISIINKSFKELEKLRDETKDEYNIELFNKTQEFLQKYKDN